MRSTDSRSEARSCKAEARSVKVRDPGCLHACKYAAALTRDIDGTPAGEAGGAMEAGVESGVGVDINSTLAGTGEWKVIVPNTQSINGL